MAGCVVGVGRCGEFVCAVWGSSCGQLYNPMAALHGGGLLGLYDQQPGLSRGDEGAASGRQEHAGIGKGSGCATEAHQGQR